MNLPDRKGEATPLSPSVVGHDAATTSPQKLHNAQLPIHSLPQEIFMLVVAHAIDLCREWEIAVIPDGMIFMQQHSERLIELASISNYWNSVINSSPSLWAHIDETDPLYQLALRKSGTSGIEVLSSLPCTSTESEFVERCAAHRHRWKSLIVEKHSTAESLLDQDLPSLTRLYIEVSGRSSDSYAWPRAPLLEVLYITYLTINRIPNYKLVRKLTLEQCEIPHAVLYDALDGMPLVERLRMVGNALGPSDVDIPSGRIIELNQLRRLHISCYNQRDRSSLEPDFVDRLRAPHLTHLCFHGLLGNGCVDLFRQLLPQNKGHRLYRTVINHETLRDSPSELWISTDSRFTKFNYSTDRTVADEANCVLIFEVIAVEAEVTLPVVLSNLLDQSGDPNVDIRFSDSSWRAHFDFRTLPTLRKMKIVSSDMHETSFEFLTSLGGKLPDGTWPCPKLEEIEGEFCKWGSKIVLPKFRPVLLGLQERMRVLPFKLRASFHQEIDYDQFIKDPDGLEEPEKEEDHFWSPIIYSPELQPSTPE